MINLTWWDLFEVLVNMFQSAALLYFGNAVLRPNADRPASKWNFLFFWIFGSILQTLHYFHFFPEWLPNIASSVVVFLLYAVLYYGGRFIAKALWCAAFFTIYGSIAFLFYSISVQLPGVTPELMAGSTSARLIHILTVNLMLPSIIFVLKKASMRFWEDATDKNIIFGTIAMLLTNLIIMFGLLDFVAVAGERMESAYMLVIIAIAVFVTNGLILWMFHRINEQNMNMMELKFNRQRMEMELKHAEESREIDEGLRRWRHDQHHRLQLMLSYADNNDYESLKSYLMQIEQDFGEITTRIHTGNKIMDALINAKATVAQSQRIAFDADMVLPETLLISEDDLTILMENLLDNAIEACKQLTDTEKKVIHIRGYVQQGTLTIEVRNNYNTETKLHKGIFTATSKQNDGQPHGLGLRIIDNIVQGYHGYVSRRPVGQEYVTQILFPARTLSSLE